MSAPTLLRASNVEKIYSGSHVLHAVNVDAAPGKITALIGPNGAGKTTLFDVIAGFIRAESGTVTFRGQDITRKLAFRRARLGIVKTFQIPHEFGTLSVEQNLLVAAADQAGERFPQVLWALGAIARQEARHSARAREVLAFLDLDGKAGLRADELSAGDKKLLELARALMLAPTLLMLDEPLAGIPASLVARILEHLLKLRAGGMTLLVVEHNLEAILRIADWVYVLVDGEVLASGTPAQVQRDERVQNAYLGGSVQA